MSRGHDAEAVAVIHAVAEYNGVKSSLTLQDLTSIGVSKNLDSFDSEAHVGEGVPAVTTQKTSGLAAVKRLLGKYDLDHVKGLFATRRLAWSTSLIISIWALIGLGEHRGFQQGILTRELIMSTPRISVPALQRFHHILLAESRRRFRGRLHLHHSKKT